MNNRLSWWYGTRTLVGLLVSFLTYPVALIEFCFLFRDVRVNVIRFAVELIDERAFLFGPVLGELGVDALMSFVAASSSSFWI
jgi:hypothetical protein